MSKYLDGLNEEVRAYFKILSPEFPEWLLEYIDTPEMQRLSKISINCGLDYTRVFNIRYWYSSLDHSVGVALIIWHFTKDKKQTIAGLLHDISTPAFKHAIDFLHGDYEQQESSEEHTVEMIKNSKQIRDLLKRDGIKLAEVIDYTLYPIADNETPKLSADRFEYSFSQGLVLERIWELGSIKECYDNVLVLKNEEGIDELGFKDVKVCEKWVATVSNLWSAYIRNANKAGMQFLADAMMMAQRGGLLP